jgi:8-oxo-dGTP pyrophosphatase MutT (NUDIX family)
MYFAIEMHDRIKDLIANEAKSSRYQDQCSLVLKSYDPYSRMTEAGHITASGLVIKNEKVLLILHPYIKEWLQPGGHIDKGESPIESAIREVFEETGYVCELDSLNLDPLDIDIHKIPENSKKGEGEHIHIDLLYRLKALDKIDSPEEISCHWFTVKEIKNQRMRRVLTKKI